MKLAKLARKDIPWLKSPLSFDGSIISTRIRLARNLNSYPFPVTADSKALKACRSEVFNALAKSSFFKNSTKISLDNCSDIDRRLLLERHLISHEMAVSENFGALIIDDREQMSIMVNEEDHLRIQYISGGLNLFDSWKVINKADDELSSILDFAYSEKFGYLTACPTNTGTGMRASCQMHLPGLALSGDLISTMESINKMGMVVRGLHGEGTEIMGDVLQVSNQVTLGISEQRILDNLDRLAIQVSQREKKIRENLMRNDPDTIKDKVFRSKGILLNAHKITFTEALDLISALRLGIYIGIIEHDIDKLNNLMIKILPAHIQEVHGKEMNSKQRNKLRANIIKETLHKA